MKQLLMLPGSIFLFALVMFTACKKSDSADPEVPLTDTQLATYTDDEAFMSSETDAAFADANLLLESDNSFSGNYIVLTKPVCDANVSADYQSDPMKLTITYDGESCVSGRTRTGVIVVSMPKGTEWKNAGAFVNVTFQSFKVTRTSDGKSVILNGTHTYTNASGGLLYQLSDLDSIVHTVVSTDMSVTFDTAAARKWNVSKKRVYSYNNGLVLSVMGTHTEGSTPNIAEWGTNRFGKSFSTAITSPLVFSQSCAFRLGAGTVSHVTGGFTATATFGLDVTGTATGCPGDGHYYYKLEWSRLNGNPSSVILPY